MQDQNSPHDGHGSRQGTARRAASGGDVVDFASWVIGLIASRRAAEHQVMRLDLLSRFREVIAADNPSSLTDFLAALPTERIDAATLADLYIPAMARMLGEDWLDDRASFAEVSLASARLQAMLREIGLAWSSDRAREGRGTLLLAVPPGEQHTLGAMVLIGQLRRLGISVRLVCGPDGAEAAKVIETGHFEGVLLSLSCTNRLAAVRGFIECLRRASPRRLPIVAGGSAVQAGVLTAAELAEVTGADLVTSDLHHALRFCGLAEARPGSRRRA